MDPIPTFPLLVDAAPTIFGSVDAITVNTVPPKPTSSFFVIVVTPTINRSSVTSLLNVAGPLNVLIPALVKSPLNFISPATSRVDWGMNEPIPSLFENGLYTKSAVFGSVNSTLFWLRRK